MGTKWEQIAFTSLIDFNHVLTALDIPFWLDYGCLLGAVRDKKLVTGKDIDVGLLEASSQKLPQALDNLSNLGFKCVLRQFEIGSEIYRMVELRRFGIHIDVSIYKKMGEFAIDLHGRYYDKRVDPISILRLIKWAYQQLPLSSSLRTELNLKGSTISRLFLSLDYFPRKSALDLPSSVRYVMGWYMYQYAKIPFRFFAQNIPIMLYGQQFNVPDSTEEYLFYLYGSNWRSPDPSYRTLHAAYQHYFVVKNPIETKHIIG
jgi:phosphorylcholine metabolism protein LicD